LEAIFLSSFFLAASLTVAIAGSHHPNI
jgi:hypothetical protein